MLSHIHQYPCQQHWQNPRSFEENRQDLLQHYLDTDESDSPSTSPSEDGEDRWCFPDIEVLQEQLQLLSADNESARAWLSLLEFKPRKHKGDPRWWPGDTLIEFSMFCFRYNPTLSITREIVQKVLDMLLTFKEHGIINENVEIPASAFTIERLMENLPQPPISLVLFKLSLHSKNKRQKSGLTVTFVKHVICLIMTKNNLLLGYMAAKYCENSDV